MPKATTVFTIGALAGIAATLGVRKRSTRPAAVTPPPVSAASHRTAWDLPETAADRAAEIIAIILIVVAAAGIVVGLIVPAVARAMPASNEEIRSHYGINVIDNQSYKGATFLKGGDDGLAYVCDRPSTRDVLASKDLSCHVA